MATRRLPSYRLHRPSGRAVVTLDGKDHYLGKHGSRESKAEYRRLIADWQDDLRRRPALSAEALSYPLTVSEIAIAYWRHVETYYVKDGQPTSEQSNIQQALRFVRSLYGPTQAKDFGPLALKKVREAMIEKGRCRKLINKDIHRVRGMFRWAAAEELYPGARLEALRAVTALEKGRSNAKERPPSPRFPTRSSWRPSRNSPRRSAPW